MFHGSYRSVLALLLMAAVASLCVASCFASAVPEKQSAAHACCHKNKKQSGADNAKPARDCDGQPAEAARSLMTAAPDFLVEPVRIDAPAPARFAEAAPTPLWSPPDRLALHQTLLI